MVEHSSIKWPITLAVVMILLLLAITVGWIIMTAANVRWVLLTVGTLFLVLVLVGVVMYLSLSIKEINLNRRQSNFMDSVTHELKSPIASLKLYLQTLNQREVCAAEQRDFFRFMLEDVDRLDHLINHLLDAARLGKQANESDVEAVRLDVLLRDCCEELRLRYRVANDGLQVDLPPFTVRGRRVELDMIFRNLIDNAFKYAGDPPAIRVTAEFDQENMVRVEVADNGLGIPPRLRRKVFGRFFRVGDELKRHKPGTGLGLYIVKTLIRRMRGHVRVRDQETGPGTVFEVRIPGRSTKGQAPDVEYQQTKDENNEAIV